MIFPKIPQSSAAIAAHYDELDGFYREIWGSHVHHGYWREPSASPEQAVEALVELVAQHLGTQSGQNICDIGCGYGATARYLARHYAVNVTGITISGAQAGQAPAARNVAILHADWLANDFPAEYFDHAYAIESSEHMPDKRRFFAESFRTLKPGGRLVICAWLAADHPTPWQIRHLLEPICREGRLPGMGTATDYLEMAQTAGFQVSSVTDISEHVSKTWRICARRFVGRLATSPRYARFLFSRANPNRIFALTLFRIMHAYRVRAMRYCVLTFTKPAFPPAGTQPPPRS